MRASLVSMLLLFFTLVLFYQNCSQSGSSGLFGPDTGGTTTASKGSFTIKFVVPNTENEISVAGLRWNSLFGGIIESSVITGSNSKKSVIACIYVPVNGSVNTCLSQVPSYVLGSSESDCSSGAWQNLDCANQINWRSTGSQNGKYVEADFLGVTEGDSCAFSSINSIYIYAKPNDGVNSLDLSVHSRILNVGPCL